MTHALLPADRTRGALPANADVVVVGGGLAGTALAYYLARDGVDVLVLERSELNREASGTNAGSFHFQPGCVTRSRPSSTARSTSTARAA